MVDLVGIEPTTSSMPWKRAPNCATGPLLQDHSIVSKRERIVKPDTLLVNSKRRRKVLYFLGNVELFARIFVFQGGKAYKLEEHLASGIHGNSERAPEPWPSRQGREG